MGYLAGLWGGGKAKAARNAAEAVLLAVSTASRDPGLYGEGRAPDTFEVRLEMLMLHGALAMMRLRQDPADAPTAQIFTDLLFKHIEYGLREAGVGDLTVPKKMKKLAGAFYGRLQAYEQGLTAPPDSTELEQALIRNILLQSHAGFAPVLARHARALSTTLTKHKTAELGQAALWAVED